MGPVGALSALGPVVGLAVVSDSLISCMLCLQKQTLKAKRIKMWLWEKADDVHDVMVGPVGSWGAPRPGSPPPLCHTLEAGEGKAPVTPSLEDAPCTRALCPRTSPCPCLCVHVCASPVCPVSVCPRGPPRALCVCPRASCARVCAPM